jgi:tetratricopeptide (TPR) repeat protein
MGLKLKSVTDKVLLTGLLLQITSLTNAQGYLQNPKYGDTEEERRECASNLSTMTEFVKINMYDYAYDAWKKCYMLCPGSSKNIYIYGARILKQKIENAPDQENADKWLDTLMQMYDKRIKHYNQEDYVLGIKGIDLLKYKPDSIRRGYEYLKKSLQLGKAKSEEAVCVTFIQASNILFKSNLKPANEFIEDYVFVSDLLNLKFKATNAPECQSALGNVETIFAESGAADCDALITIFAPKYKDTPDDVNLLKNITNLLDRAGCNESELFTKASESLYKLEPSAKAAYLIGVIFEKKGDYARSKEYYGLAAKQETNPDEKANYLYKIGYINFRMEKYPETRSNALEALSYRPNFGDAYILIGSAYAASSSSCGTDQFEKTAVYWAAVDMFMKAKSVDPEIADKANEQINKYTPAFPNNEEAFFRGFTDGQEYTVGCWINEKTTVRTRKN